MKNINNLFMKKIKALILSPMDASYKRIRDTIQKTLQESDVTSIQIDKFLPGTLFTNAIAEAIQKSDFIIADVSSKNPNVIYEVGFAHGLRKPTLLMLSTDSRDEMPYDLVGYQMATYDPNNLESLKRQIYRFVRYQKSRWEKQNV